MLHIKQCATKHPGGENCKTVNLETVNQTEWLKAVKQFQALGLRITVCATEMSNSVS